jgi:hypothetical protein
MRNLIITAAAVTAVATLALPAGAVEAWGPSRVGNQCFSPAAGGTGTRDLVFGTWGACPQPAAIATAPKTKKK